MLLDEATSALDSLTERDVHERLDTLGCTRIIIAHRLSTIRNADLILVMEDGRLVEQGTHAALVRKSGAYAGLVAAQAGEPAASATTSETSTGTAPRTAPPKAPAPEVLARSAKPLFFGSAGGVS
jgi:ABC-type glutathione transport system ATPase component